MEPEIEEVVITVPADPSAIFYTDDQFVIQDANGFAHTREEADRMLHEQAKIREAELNLIKEDV